MSEHNGHSGENGLRLKTILVVDDDANIREAILQTLKMETLYLAILAADGFEALKIIKSLKLDLFVLDYQLPGMDGIELYDHLHRTEGLEHVPALLMSTYLPTEELEKRGVSSIKKPFELAELVQTIQKLLAE